MNITFTLNGKKISRQIEADTLLIDLVRDLGCYSVKRGCETSNCGLCTVFMDDQPILSCSILAARVDGHKIDTLEGLQEEAAEFGAFIANQGAEQCGFCNPGMIMNAIALFREIPDPTEEEIKEYGKQLLEDKILLMGMKYEKKDYPRLYGTLYAIGVNSVIWIDGEEKIEIEIGKIANQRDMSKIEPSKRPLLNPSLELSGIYFMQELRRPVKQEEHKNIRELEEELIANLRKAEFLIAINAEQEEDGKLHIPYLKNKEDKIMQPVFTDVMEFEKFGRGKNLRVAKVTIDKLPSLMIPQANAYVVNPMGFNLVLNKEQIEKIAGISK